MDKHDDHLELIKSYAEEQKEIFDSSEQAVYAFLDDDNRVCNERFAKLLGYSSADEWMSTETNGEFPSVFVDEKSHETLVDTYQKTMESMVASTVKITWKKKDSGTVETSVVFVPVVYQGHLVALHFVS